MPKVMDVLVAVGLASETEQEKAAKLSKQQEQASIKPSVSSIPAPSIPSPPTSADIDLIQGFDNEARGILIESMRSAGAPLVMAAADLVDVFGKSIPDQRTLYISVLQMMKKNGVTVSNIRRDYEKCIGALDAQDKLFTDELHGQLEKRVGTRLRAVEAANQQIQAKRDQIAQLQSEIEHLESSVASDKSNIADEQRKMDLSQQRFTICYKSIRAEVEAQLQKIVQFGDDSK